MRCHARQLEARPGTLMAPSGHSYHSDLSFMLVAAATPLGPAVAVAFCMVVHAAHCVIGVCSFACIIRFQGDTTLTALL